MFDVRLSAKAQDFYRKADKPLARKLARCFKQLEREPVHHSNIKPLKGKLAGFCRYRVGDYRVIYQIDNRRQVVRVLKIAHRSEVYE